MSQDALTIGQVIWLNRSVWHDLIWVGLTLFSSSLIEKFSWKLDACYQYDEKPMKEFPLFVWKSRKRRWNRCVLHRADIFTCIYLKWAVSTMSPCLQVQSPVRVPWAEVAVSDMCQVYVVQVRCKLTKGMGSWSEWSDSVYSTPQNSRGTVGHQLFHSWCLIKPF